MNRLLLIIALAIVAVACHSTSKVQTENVNQQESDNLPPQLAAAMTAVKPFFAPLPSPGPTDWLASFKEPGQSFAEYIGSTPTVPTDERKTIYVLPLGTFTDKQSQVIAKTSVYLEAFFGLSVKTLPQRSIERPLRIKDTRTNAISKKSQIRTGHILDEILKPMLPNDAAALIAFTNEDLFPDSTMSYVFGQASLEDRVGVWSLYRLDDNADLKTFLLRTIKAAAHETGHMFSMHHCIAYNCVMSGSNHLAETDSHPIDACPECMAKVCWFSNVSPADRYQRLVKVCHEIGLTKEADAFQKKFEAVRDIK